MRPIDADALKEEVWKAFPHFLERLQMAPVFALIREAPTIDAEQKWIPVSERLPDDDRTKVVTLANGNVEAGYYSNGDWWCIGDTISLANPTVIAWMPLPLPWKGAQKRND